MTYKGGTPTAQSCIEQLKDLEALVDIYSKEWLAANPDYCDFYPEDLVEYQHRTQSEPSKMGLDEVFGYLLAHFSTVD